MKYSYLIIAASIAALSGCGGGSSSDSDSPTSPNNPPPQSANKISATGVITSFDGVVVNGERFVVNDETVVAIEGEAETVGDDSSLQLGMRVTIEATARDGMRTAQRIEYDEDLKGPARGVAPDDADPSVGSFSVVNQVVIVDENTVFDDDIGDNDGVPGIDIRDLAAANFPGNAPIVVEVSGFPTETGLLATRIDRVNAAAGDIGRPGVSDDELEIKGFVDAVADDALSFSVNAATFIVANTIFEDGLAADQSLVGVFVEVKADIDSEGQLIAVRVEREDDFGKDDDDEFEIEGVLQSVDTASNPNVIVINGLTLEIEDASALTTLVGTRVEIKGERNAQGVLVISRTKLEVENTIRIQDRVSGIAAADGVFTTRLGIDIVPTLTTRIKDEFLDDKRLSIEAFLADLAVGDFIEARAFISSESILWTRIEREDDDDQECRLRGPIDADSINDPFFSILGVVVDTSGLDNDDFEGPNDLAIGRSEFFNLLEAGTVVEAKSDDAGLGCTNAMLSTGADGEVSLEGNDDASGDGSQDGDNDSNDDDYNEIVGTLRSLNAELGTFSLGGRQISVTAATLIDDSIVEKARAVEIDSDSIPLGELPETLDQLLSNGDLIRVRIAASGEAIEIEDV